MDASIPSKITDLKSAAATSADKGKAWNVALIGGAKAAEGRDDRMTHIKGEVIRAADNGRVQIRTPGGTLEVQMPPNQKGTADIVKAGDTVEIEIPPKKARERNGDMVQIRVQPDRATPEKTQKASASEQAPETTPDKTAQTTEPAPREAAPERSIEVKTIPYQPPAGNQSAQAVQDGVQQQCLSNAQGVKAEMLAQIQRSRLALSQAAQMQGGALPLATLPKEALAQMPAPLLHTIPASVNPAAFMPAPVQATPASTAHGNAAAQAVIQAAPPLDFPLTTPYAGLETAVFQNLTSPLLTAAQGFALEAATGAPFPVSAGAPMTTTMGHLPSSIRSITPPPVELVKHLAPGAIKLGGAIAQGQTTVAASAITLTGAGTGTPPPPIQGMADLGGLALPPVTLSDPATPPPTAITGFPSLKDFIAAQQAEQKNAGKTEASILLNTPRIGTITATLSGYTPQYLPVLTLFPEGDGLPPQSFLLQLPLKDLPPGMQITLAPHSLSVQASALSGVQQGSQAPLPPASYFLTPGGWPVMSDIAQTLQQAASAAAHNSGQGGGAALLPSPASPSQFGAAALFVFAALKTGDLAQTLNERAQDLLRHAGKSDAIGRLNAEGQIINRAHADSAGQDWRALALPLQWQQDVQKIAVFYKHQDEEDAPDNARNKGKQTRFIFDLALSKMGKVQLDGLHRQDRLDLIVRTREPFSRAMQMQMKNAYTQAMESSNLGGELAFQNDPQSWVNIQVKDNEKFKARV